MNPPDISFTIPVHVWGVYDYLKDLQLLVPLHSDFDRLKSILAKIRIKPLTLESQAFENSFPFRPTGQNHCAEVLGFLGVILTLFVNAYLARCARKRAIEYERKTIRTALREELKCKNEELHWWQKQMIGFSATEEAKFRFVIHEPPIYNAVLKDIGTLMPEQATATIRAHTALMILNKEMYHRYAPSTSNGVINIPGNELMEIHNTITHTIKLVSAAIVALR